MQKSAFPSAPAAAFILSAALAFCGLSAYADGLVDPCSPPTICGAGAYADGLEADPEGFLRHNSLASRFTPFSASAYVKSDIIEQCKALKAAKAAEPSEEESDEGWQCRLLDLDSQIADANAQAASARQRLQLLIEQRRGLFEKHDLCGNDEHCPMICRSLYRMNSKAQAACLRLPKTEAWGLVQDAIMEWNIRHHVESMLPKENFRYTSCKDDLACHEACGFLYPDSRDVRSQKSACLQLSLGQVEAFQDIYRILNKAESDDLRGMDYENFKLFAETGTHPIKKSIERMTLPAAKRLIKWIIETPEIAQVFRHADLNSWDSPTILEAILNSLVPYGGADRLQKALAKRIMEGQSFIELAIEDGGYALNWIHDMVSRRCSQSRHSSWALCVFQDWYCKMDLDSNGADWIDLLNNEDFDEAMNSVLFGYSTQSAANASADKAGEGGRAQEGAAPWWQDDTEAVDVDMSEFHKMCSWRDQEAPTPAAPNIVGKSFSPASFDSEKQE